MPSERRFRNDSTKANRFHKPDDGDDRMNENDEDVVHDGIVSNLKNSQNSGRFCNSPPTSCSLRTAGRNHVETSAWCLRNQPGDISCFQRDRVFGSYGVESFIDATPPASSAQR